MMFAKAFINDFKDIYKELGGKEGIILNNSCIFKFVVIFFWLLQYFVETPAFMVFQGGKKVGFLVTKKPEELNNLIEKYVGKKTQFG